MKKTLKILSTFSTSGIAILFTHLFCCGLPAFFSILGIGAGTLGASNLSFLEEYKELIFAFSGVMLLISIFIYFHDKKACPIHKKNCSKAKKISNYILLITIIFYVGSFYLAFFYHPSCAIANLPPLPME